MCFPIGLLGSSNILEVEVRLPYYLKPLDVPDELKEEGLVLESLYLPFKMYYYVKPIEYKVECDFVFVKDGEDFILFGDPFFPDGIEIIEIEDLKVSLDYILEEN